MKKKAMLIVPFALSAMTLAACGTTTEEAQEEKVVDESEVKTEEVANKEETASKKDVATSAAEDMELVEFEGVSFQIPNTFTELSNETDLGLPYLSYSFGVGNSFNVVVEDLSVFPGITLEEYIDASVANTGYEYTSNEYLDVNGIEGNQVETVAMEGIKLQQTTVIHDEKAYIFSYGSLEDTFDSNRIQSVLDSISFN